MTEVVFNEIEFTSADDAVIEDDIVYAETVDQENTSISDLVVSDPFFMGMKIGGIAVIISLGAAVIITIFKRLSNI